MLPTELPTLRSTLRHGLLLQEEKRDREGVKPENYPNLYKYMAIAVNNQWLKANAEYVPPKVITMKSLERKIQTDWETARDICK